MSNCIDCNQLPKALPKHRCYWCGLRKQGTDAEVAGAVSRRLAVEENPNCLDCQSLVPSFYMKTKNRCRGCELLRVRDRDAQKKYGLEPGTRQKWYDAQGGKCYGCGKRQLVTGLAVHHSHLTGEPFYLACLTCNQGVMGMAMDNPMTLIRLGLGMLIPPHRDNGQQAINKILGQLPGLMYEE